MANSPVFTFFNEHPVFPVIVLTSTTVAILPILLLLYISQIAPLHGNCRFILCAWVIGLGALVAADSALAIVDLQNESGYMPTSMSQPQTRVKLYKWNVFWGTFCSTIEIALSFEQIVSVIRPRHYHFSKTAWKTMIVVTFSLMTSAYFIDEAVLSETETLRLVASAIMAIIEVLVLVAGATASRICENRYRRMYGKSTLTERYQAKEAYEMSKAMIPAYIISFIIKATTVTAISIYVAFVRDGYLTGYFQTCVIMSHVCFEIFSTSNLLLTHPLLRKHTKRKIGSLMKLKPEQERRRNSFGEDTETYFSMYSASWK